MKVETRMFSAPDFESLCRRPARPNRLAPRHATLRIAPGDWFDPSRLRVMAVGGRDEPVPAAPVSIEVEDVDPSVFDLRSSAVSSSRIMALRMGRAKFHVRSLCDDLFAEITVEVTNVPSIVGDWTFAARTRDSVLRARLLIEQFETELLATLLIDNHVLEGAVSLQGLELETELVHADGTGPGHSERLILRGTLESGQLRGRVDSGADQIEWTATKTQF